MRKAMLLLLLLGAPYPAGAAPSAVTTTDLADTFGTRSPWRFTAVQDAPQADPLGMGPQVPGVLHPCVSRDDGRRCEPPLGSALVVSGKPDLYDVPHAMLDDRIVRLADNTPLLLLQFASLSAANGDRRRATMLLRYDRDTDRFVPVYAKRVGSNNNQDIRFIGTGPLRGAVIDAEPTEDAPFGYWITVSRFRGEHYAAVLRFRSATRYNDGNGLAVIDAEMPGIERRLRLWRPGQTLPLPATPCPAPHLHDGAMWCVA